MDGLHRVLAKKLQGKLDPVEQELMDPLASSIRKLNATIRDLTEIVKVQKEARYEQEAVYFAQLLDDVNQDIAPLIEEASARINTLLNVECIYFARKHLRSILYNLLSNAVKYRSPDRPLQIDIRTWQEGDYVHLAVSDNGLGIDPDQIGKIFQMFKRLHTHVEGTGIGLYMVKRIIENNGGRITVESTQGKGTTFSVSLLQDKHMHRMPVLQN